MSDNKLAVDPHELRSAAHRLDELASRLHGALAKAGQQTTVSAAGGDEVSVRAASTFNTVARGFDDDGDSAVLELRKIAAVLRAQANAYGSVEDANAVAFRA